jgi:hypothetical protein
MVNIKRTKEQTMTTNNCTENKRLSNTNLTKGHEREQVEYVTRNTRLSFRNL